MFNNPAFKIGQFPQATPKKPAKSLANPTRRRFMALGGGLAVASFAALSLPAQALSFYDDSRRVLTFFNTHTQEVVGGNYFSGGAYNPQVLRQFCYILRDFRAGEAVEMDPRLFDVLHRLQATVQNFSRIEIISGYRSPSTNRWLAAQSHGVAKNSYHMRGQAIDLRLAGTPLTHLHRAALSLAAGGVGYYPASDFVHVDTGPLRSWGNSAG